MAESRQLAVINITNSQLVAPQIHYDIDNPIDRTEFADRSVTNPHELHGMPFMTISYHDVEVLCELPQGHSHVGYTYKPTYITKSPYVNLRRWRAEKKLDPSWKPPENVVKKFCDWYQLMKFDGTVDVEFHIVYRSFFVLMEYVGWLIRM